VQRVRDNLRESAAGFRAVVGSPNLRRLVVAWALAIVGHWAYLVAVSVYAFMAGGSTAVGIITAVRLCVAAFVAPFVGVLGDRHQRERILLVSNLSRTGLIGAAAVAVFADAPPIVIYALAVAAAIATTAYRPAQAALLPSLARTPGELTSTNAVVSTIESLAIFIGPAIAGFLLAVASTGVVFTVNAAMLAASTFFLVRIKAPRVEKKPEVESATIVSELFAGFRAILQHRSLRIMIGLLTAQNALEGAVQVYIVVAGVELLGLGTSGVGYLNSAIGIGALIGGFVALSLTGVRRLSPAFLLGVAFMGVPVALIGIWPEKAFALLMFGVLGFAACIMDVAGLTIVQRVVPDDVLARVFGVIQMLWYLSLSVGALVAPALVGAIGIEGALVVTGVYLIVLVVLGWIPVARIDASAAAPAADELRILASVPILAPLPGSSLEHLAGRLVPLRVDAGTIIVREGDTGDRFYMVVEGEVEVSEDGRPISELGPGGYFGEIALIRNVPRTATVTARTPAVLYAMEREDFLAAVTGHPPSAEAAETVVSSRLARVAQSGVQLPAG
jgi:MFS family permease